MERSFWRSLITISLIVVVGIWWVTPPVYGYDVPDFPQWQDGDDENVEGITLGEMRRALWYKEQFDELVTYVGRIEVALETTMEERDETLDESAELILENDDLKADNTALGVRINRVRARLVAALSLVAVLAYAWSR